MLQKCPKKGEQVRRRAAWCRARWALSLAGLMSAKGAAFAQTAEPAFTPAQPVPSSAPETGSVEPTPTASPEAAPVPTPPVEPAELATLLADAATDLGLVAERPPAVSVVTGTCVIEDEPLPSSGKVFIRGALERRGESWWLRVSVLKDDGTTHSASAKLDAENYEVQAIRTLALTVKTSPGPKETIEKEPASALAASVDVSQGKATLATHGAALGGYFGFALESAGGDVDTRLVYPLIALGAGVGLATALIVAEEWPVNRASAWYISGGGTWLTIAGVLVASELDLKHPSDRYPYGLIGTAAGLGISTLVVSQRDISEGEAVFSHSGAIFGAIAGGFIQELADPVSGKFPRLGVGIGTAGGWLAASLGTARFLPRLTASRVLFADLGGFLGVLVGAAAASPAVVNEGPPKAEDRRAFVAAGLSGLVLGSVVGYWLGGTVEDSTATLPVSLRATTLAPTLASTPFDQGLPSATALTLYSQW